MFNSSLYNMNYHSHNQMMYNYLWVMHDRLIHELYGFHIKYTTLDVERNSIIHFMKGVLQVYV